MLPSAASTAAPKAPLVALDLDEVLGQFVAPLCEFHNAAYGTSLSQADFHSYRFADVWGGTDAEATRKVEAFFQSPHFARAPVVDGARGGVAALRARGLRLGVVTSRQLAIEGATRAWLRAEFGDGAFERVVFGNHWGTRGRKVGKAQLCKEVGACVLVDDSPRYVREVREAGVGGVLFDLHGAYGWAKGGCGGAETVRDWDGVVEAVARLVPWEGAGAGAGAGAGGGVV